MAIDTSLMRYKVEFNLNESPITLDFTDLNPSGAYSTPANVKGLLAIKNSSGTYFYKNAGYDTDSFTSPDTDGSTPDWTKDGISIMLNTSGLPVTGTYTIEYKVSEDSGVTTYTVTKTYDYDISTPIQSLSGSSDCDTSNATWTDSSTYNITDYNNTTITPTITRAWEITTNATSYTQGTITAGNLTTVTIGMGTSYNSGTILYTGDYYGELTATVQYVLDTWSGTDWFIVNDVLVKSYTVSVQCDTCTCNYYACYKAISERYDSRFEDKISENEINMLRTTLTLAGSYYNGYLMALRCGQEDTSYWCNLIQEQLDKVASCCGSSSTSTSDINNPVIPIAITAYMAAYGSSSSMITFGTAAVGLPLSPIPSQVHIFTTTAGSYTAWDVWYWNAVTWTLQGNILGAAGTSELAVLHNDISDSIDGAAVTAQTLKTYTLVGGTMATDGTYLEIDAYLDVKTGIIATANIYLDGFSILSHSINTSAQTQLHLKATLNRTGAATQITVPIVEYRGLPNSILEGALTSSAKTMASANDITVVVQKTLAGGAGDITCKYLKVVKYSKS